MKTRTSNAVINFVYFTANFPNLDFFNIWEPNLRVHFRSKFDTIVNKAGLGYVSVECFIKFFFELSSSHQEELADWIETNYHFSSSHKYEKPETSLLDNLVKEPRPFKYNRKPQTKKPNEGKQCKHCGHLIYWVKYHGYRCWCDKAEPKS